MGMNLEDLTLTAEEMRMRADPKLPNISSHVTFPEKTAGTEKDLRLLHRSLSKSFKEGFPPVANITRTAFRKTKGSGHKILDTLGSHSVVLTEISPILYYNGIAYFEFNYVDPALGKELKGTVSLPDPTTWIPAYTFVVTAPESDIFQKIISRSTPSYLSLSSVIGVL